MMAWVNLRPCMCSTGYSSSAISWPLKTLSTSDTHDAELTVVSCLMAPETVTFIESSVSLA